MASFINPKSISKPSFPKSLPFTKTSIFQLCPWSRSHFPLNSLNWWAAEKWEVIFNSYTADISPFQRVRHRQKSARCCHYLPLIPGRRCQMKRDDILKPTFQICHHSTIPHAKQIHQASKTSFGLNKVHNFRDVYVTYGLFHTHCIDHQ